MNDGVSWLGWFLFACTHSFLLWLVSVQLWLPVVGGCGVVCGGYVVAVLHDCDHHGSGCFVVSQWLRCGWFAVAL